MSKLIIITVLALLFCNVSTHPKVPPIPKVVEGASAVYGQFPWHVGLAGYSEVEETRVCSGAIINESWIIATAYCLDASVLVGFHTGSINRFTPDEVIWLATNFTIHDDFNNETLKNDIALIYVDPPLKFNKNSKPIKLPDSDDEVKEGFTGTVAGWSHAVYGRINKGPYVLKYAKVTTISNEKCQAVYGQDAISTSVVCTSEGDFEKTPCFSDGGATLIADSEEPVLVGIYSFSSGLNCENYPAGYTRIAHYKKWIQEITGIE